MADTTIKALEAVTGGTDLGAIDAMQGATPVKIGKTHLVNAAGAAFGTTTNPIQIGDAGGSITVDGTVSVGNFPATQAVSGTVAVSSVGGTVTVVDGGGSITVDGSVSVSGTATVAGTVTANQGTAGAQAWPVSDGGASLTVDGTISVGNFPANQGVNLASGPGTSVATPAFMRRVPNDLAVNATGAAAAAVTLTIPAVAGQFHYIDAIEITLYSTAARTGAAAPVTVSSTNLPGNPTWLFESAGAIGTAVRYALSASCAFKSTTVNTATTIVCPAVTGGLWNVKAIYSTAP